MRTYFNTSPLWIDILRQWAASNRSVSRMWLFGSRVTGVRTPHHPPRPVPDLDVAVELIGATEGERLGEWICEREGWSDDLRARLPVALDMRLCDFDSTDELPKWVAAVGLLIYERQPAA